jgi:hypothetical protein
MGDEARPADAGDVAGPGPSSQQAAGLADLLRIVSVLVWSSAGLSGADRKVLARLQNKDIRRVLLSTSSRLRLGGALDTLDLSGLQQMLCSKLSGLHTLSTVATTTRVSREPVAVATCLHAIWQAAGQHAAVFQRLELDVQLKHGGLMELHPVITTVAALDSVQVGALLLCSVTLMYDGSCISCCACITGACSCR